MRERRSVPRYQYRAHGRLILSSGSPVIQVDFTTLSVRGCRVKGEAIPAMGQRCQVALQWEGLEFRAEAEVKWRKPDGDAGLGAASTGTRRGNGLGRLVYSDSGHTPTIHL